MIRYLFLIAIGLYLLSNMISHPSLEVVLSVVSLLAVIASVAFVSKIVLAFGLAFLSIGVILLVTSGSEISHYLFAFGEMLNLLTLFALIPILALPIRLGNYAKDVEAVIKKSIKSSGQLYMVSSGISYFLSSFMNLAALPMTYYSIRPSVDLFQIKYKERFMSRSITHGFAMPLLWTPVTPIVGIVIEMTGVQYGSILPILVPLSIVGLALDWCMAQLYAKKTSGHNQYSRMKSEFEKTESELSATEEQAGGNHFLRLSHILLAIIMLNMIILVTEQFIALSFLFLISLLVIPFSLTWTLLLRRGKEYVHALKEHFDSHLSKMKDQFFLFLSAGFFISAINISGADHAINRWLSQVIDMFGVQWVLVLLPFVPLALAFLGLHPAVAFVLIVEALNPEVLGLTPLVMTFAMLGSAVPAFMMGPYNATLGVMSNIVQQSPFRVSNWNVPFTMTYMVGLIIFLQGAQYIF